MSLNFHKYTKELNIESMSSGGSDSGSIGTMPWVGRMYVRTMVMTYTAGSRM